jgi:hypothetical protein
MKKNISDVMISCDSESTVDVLISEVLTQKFLVVGLEGIAQLLEGVHKLAEGVRGIYWRGTHIIRPIRHSSLHVLQQRPSQRLIPQGCSLHVVLRGIELGVDRFAFSVGTSALDVDFLDGFYVIGTVTVWSSLCYGGSEVVIYVFLGE